MHQHTLLPEQKLRGFANNQTGTGTLAIVFRHNGVGMSPGSILRRRVSGAIKYGLPQLLRPLSVGNTVFQMHKGSRSSGDKKCLLNGRRRKMVFTCASAFSSGSELREILAADSHPAIVRKALVPVAAVRTKG